jgi:hypothetical protein
MHRDLCLGTCRSTKSGARKRSNPFTLPEQMKNRERALRLKPSRPERVEGDHVVAIRHHFHLFQATVTRVRDNHAEELAGDPCPLVEHREEIDPAHARDVFEADEVAIDRRNTLGAARRIAHPRRVEVDCSLGGDQRILPEATVNKLRGVGTNIRRVEVEPLGGTRLARAARCTIEANTQRYLSAYPAKTKLLQRVHCLVIACVDLGRRKDRTSSFRRAQGH